MRSCSAVLLALACGAPAAVAAGLWDDVHGADGGAPRAAASSPSKARPHVEPTTQEDRQSDEPPPIETRGGFKIETRLVGIAQRVNAAGSPDAEAHTRTNFRADVFMSLGAGRIGDAKGTVSAQLRAGNGRSIGTTPTFASVNSTAFDPDDGASRTYGTVAQLYYEIELPVGHAGPADAPRPSWKLAAGKLDLFNFFDDNRVSSNENVNFINNAFVHNPLLDAGGDSAADRYGYQPGLRLNYADLTSRLRWGASLGVFASGEAADFGAAPRRPLVIAQFETAPRRAQGRPYDTYRLYAWSSPHASDVTGERQQRHTGIGVSADQRLGRDWNFFQRLGRRTGGSGAFDTALTLGVELEGRRSRHGRDAIGLAFGWLRTSTALRRFTLDGAQTGYAAGGAERITELYYRFHVNEWLQLSPDVQRIERPAGNGAAAGITVFGLRARVAF